jgi:hypothetical protein
VSIIADPFGAPQAWDAIVVAGQKSPGLCKFEELHRPFGWDVKKGKGADGATLTHTGRQLAKWKTRHQLWTPAHFIAWGSWSQLLKYEPVKGIPVQALDVFHPALVAVDVAVAIVVNLGAPLHKGKGLYEAVVEWLEYRPPPPAKATATPKSGDNAGDLPDAPKQNPLVVAKAALAKQLAINAQQAYK